MALISEYLAADLSADASADALGRINIRKFHQDTRKVKIICRSHDQLGKIQVLDKRS